MVIASRRTGGHEAVRDRAGRFPGRDIGGVEWRRVQHVLAEAKQSGLDTEDVREMIDKEFFFQK